MRLVVALIVITALNVSSLPPGIQQPKRYDNFSVYRVYINTPEQRDIVNNLLNHTDQYNLWHNGRSEIHIMVNPKELDNFKRIVWQEGLLTELLIPNVQALIDAGRSSQSI